MKATVTLTEVIECAHEAPVWFTCPDSLHGHSFEVAVEIEFDPQAAELYATPPQERFRDHLSELSGRNLNDMIRPARPNHYGLASWIMERMLHEYPVIRVSVITQDCEVNLWADEVRRR